MKFLKILLAEDASINQKFLCHFLEEYGHNVVAVQTGKEALSALKKEKFDLVLMDIQMPEMDGIEATKKIREASPERIDPNIPIIALTAYAMQEDQERFLQAGMNDYISKPLDLDNLLGIINRITENGNEGQPDTSQPAENSCSPKNIIDMEVLLSTYPHYFIRKMLKVFWDSADRTLAEIKDAIQKKDLELAEKRLHSLAGTAAIMKAVFLKRKSRELMQLAQEKNIVLLEEKISELEKEMHRVTEFIHNLDIFKN